MSLDFADAKTTKTYARECEYDAYSPSTAIFLFISKKKKQQYNIRFNPYV